MSEEMKKSPTAQSFRTYRKGMKPEIDAAKTNMKVARKGYEDAVRSRSFKRNMFKKAKAALTEYEGLLNGVVTTAHQDAIEIDKNVISYVAQSNAVKTAFDAVIGSLKAAKIALYNVELTADALAELVENSDQSEENLWLQNNVHEFVQTVKEISGDVKTKKQGLADQTNDLADDAFEVAVKVVGINASVNMESLTPLSTKLLNSITALKTDVEGNITFSLAEKLKAQTKLNEQNQSQSASRSNISRTRLSFAGLKNTEAFTRTPNCLDGEELTKQTRQRLHELVKEVEKTFSKEEC